ncbi:unnamed protein product, partial [Clonostachys chloroleuca]
SECGTAGLIVSVHAGCSACSHLRCENCYIYTQPSAKRDTGSQRDQYDQQSQQSQQSQKAQKTQTIQTTQESQSNQHSQQKVELKKDSGYESQSRHEALPALPEANVNTLEDEQGLGQIPPDIPPPSEQDLESLQSDESDIWSQSSVQTTSDVMSAKALLVSRDLEGLIDEIGKQRFSENLRRSLKMFYRSLLGEAKDERGIATARLLRSKRGRARISNQIAGNLGDKEEDEAPRFEVSRGGMNRIETWLATVPKGQHSLEDRENSRSDDDIWSSSDDDEPPNVRALKDSILASQSLKLLLRDLLFLYLPINLRGVFKSISRKNIQLLDVQKSSFLDKTKLWVEHATQVRWNWWPLEQPKRSLKSGESRILWQCTCGTNQWQDISDKQREVTRKILDLSPDVPAFASSCATKISRLSLTTRSESILQAPTLSQAAQRYTPSSARAQSSTTPSSGISNANSAISGRKQISSKGTILTSQQSQGSKRARVRSPTAAHYILLGAQGPARTLTPAEVHVNDQSTDSSVFHDLRERYEIRRGFWRMWFSIWRLEYCHVAKFNRLSLDRMTSEERELPSDVTYEYAPRNGSQGAKNPPISKHMFQTIWYACKPMCKKPSFLHDCMEVPNGVGNIKRIPKRGRSFENDQTPEIWGLEAVLAVSFAYVAFYHILFVVGPTVFWVWWLANHPNDWQNAAVPATAVLACLSLFWSGAGILTQKSSV